MTAYDDPAGGGNRPPVALTAGALIRLAGALDTPMSGLREARKPRTPVRGVAALHPVLDHLRTEECLRLIAPGGAGRIGFEADGRLTVLPVEFMLQGPVIAAQLDPTSAIAPYGGGPVAFEVERLDDDAREGWSVLISGTYRPASVQELLASRPRVDPWTEEEPQVLLVIEPEHISGRRIRLG